jgi:hypothetical protein
MADHQRQYYGGRAWANDLARRGYAYASAIGLYSIVTVEKQVARLDIIGNLAPEVVEMYQVQ